MRERDESVFVRHMLDAIARIESHLTDVDRANFRSNEVLQDAVVRQLEILGEAAGGAFPGRRARVALGFRGRRSRGFDRLIHDYFEVDLDMVWKVAIEDVPVLTPLIRSPLDEITRQV